MSIAELERAIGKAIPMEVPIILIAYMALMLLIGLWAAKRVKSSEDWFVGGREMGPWTTALAHGSSSVGGGMYIAGPQYGWEAGASSLWAAPGDVFGPLLNFGIIARRMRRYTEKTKSLTIPDFFGHRYYSQGVKLLSVIIMLVAMVISLIVEYLAIGVLLSCITGWSFEMSMLVGCVVVLIYTGAGGYLAVAYTDFVQSILMLIGLAVLIPVCISAAGGFSGITQSLYAINPGLPTLWGEDFYLKGAPLMIAGIALVYFVGYMGQPHLVIKTVAIKDEKSIRLVPLIGGIFGFFLSFGVYILGMAGRVIFPDAAALPGGSAEYIMPVLALTKLSPIMAGFLLACAFSAIMSTASALLLVIGSGAGSDLYHGFINPKASEKQVMRVTQVSTYVLGLISAVLCFAPIFQVGIYQVTWIAWSVLSPAFIPLIIGGLYWKRGTKEGAYASLIVGSVTGFAWYYLLQESTNIHTFFAAIVLATVAYVVVSLLTKEPPKEIEDMVDYAKRFEDAEATNTAVKAGVQISQENFSKIIRASKEAAPAAC